MKEANRPPPARRPPAVRGTRFRLSTALLMLGLPGVWVGEFPPKVPTADRGERKVILPETLPWRSLHRSPGMLVGPTLYLSGMPGEREDGTVPAGREEEVLLAFENLRRVLLEAGMDYESLVSCFVFVEDLALVDPLGAVMGRIFPRDPPSGAVIEVGRVPGPSRILVQAVAVQSSVPRRPVPWPSGRRSVEGSLFSAAIRVDGLVYMSAVGAERGDGDAEDEPYRIRLKHGLLLLEEILRSAGLDFRHLVYVNPNLAGSQDWAPLNSVYRQFFPFGDTPARATQTVAGLPGDEPAVFTAIAVEDLSRRRSVHQLSHPPLPTASPGVLAGDVLFTSGFRGFLPGGRPVPAPGMPFPPAAEDLETQFRFALRNVQDCVEAAGLALDDVVNLNVFLSNMEDYDEMERLYRGTFGDTPPARTVVQLPREAVTSGALIQFSAIAVGPRAGLSDRGWVERP